MSIFQTIRAFFAFSFMQFDSANFEAFFANFFLTAKFFPNSFIKNTICKFYVEPVQHFNIPGKLLLATKEIVYRERTGNLSAKKDAKKMEDPKSHGKGVTCVLYNPVFEVVVSADQYSTVCVWDYKTGKKLMQFSGCHTWNINGRIINLEITAISFDPTYRRLFTGQLYLMNKKFMRTRNKLMVFRNQKKIEIVLYCFF